MSGRSYRFRWTVLTATVTTAFGLVVTLAVSSPSSSVPPPPAFGPAVTVGQTLALANMTQANPLIPIDVYRNPAPAEQDLATYAWLEFISAVSPVNSTLRGNPGGTFVQSGANQTTTLVWETYQHKTELFPCNYVSGNIQPIAPQPWNNPPTYISAIANSSGTTVGCNPVGLQNYNNLDEATQIGQNFLFFPATLGSPQPATDGQALFEARANQYEWSFVNANYQNFQFGLNFVLPDGTVEVKAAWRPFSSIPANLQYRYHTAQVITYTGSDTNPVPQVQTYALIALHIIHKSPNYPSFIFATFEQVDNLNQQGSPTGAYYVPNYTNVTYQVPATTTFVNNQSVPNPSFNLCNGVFNPQSPFASPNGNCTSMPVGQVSNIPGAQPVSGTAYYTIPITQPVQPTYGVQTVNQLALSLMQQLPGFNQNFVWQYYQLAGVQAIPTSNENSNDFYLANNVVESSQPGIQLFRGEPHITSSGTLINYRNLVNIADNYQGTTTYYQGGGCQGCHGVAQTQVGSGFSFLFAGSGGNGSAPETIGLPPPATSAARLARRAYFTFK